MPADGGIRFGHYLLLRRIARGGMAEVFLAQQRGLEGFDRRVAVKRILPHLADSPDFVKMFLGEAKLAAQLAHPNIVHIYEFGKVEHDYFIAMEYVEGVHAGQIFKWGETNPRISPTLVARIGADASAALHYAHELQGPDGQPLGIVHRDVSPANIMVSHDGIVRLCDFGIAKAMARAEELTNPGQVKGKYAYMSPEQTIAAPLDGRSDVFSLAIVLWELLAGQLIVPRGDAVEAMRMIRDGRLRSLSDVAPHVPPPLAKAIAWALEPKREKRATAADLHGALEAFIKQSPELATPMQLAQWVRTRFPRDQSGPQRAQSSPSIGMAMGPGTSVAPATGLAAPGTVVATGTNLGLPTPPSQLIAASAVPEPEHTAETIALSSSQTEALSSDEVAAATVLERLGQELRSTTPHVAQRTTERRIAAEDEPTRIDPGAPMPGAGADTRGSVDSLDGETILVPGAQRTIVPSAPAVIPTRVEARLPSSPSDSGAALPSDSGARRLQSSPGSGPRRSPPVVTDATLGLRRARSRYLVPALVLAGVGVLTFFVVLLAARGSSAPPPDAAVVIVADAPAAVAPADARPVMAIRDAAAAEPVEPTAYLVVNTEPAGATIKVGDQTRRAPTQFALPAGAYDVVAELDGYKPERRAVTLERGEHRTYDIAFTRRVTTPGRDKPLGKLSVRTTPYSDVFHGTRKLGQSPFELELPAGSYTLLFKHPAFPTTSRTVKITANKITKVVFALPK